MGSDLTFGAIPQVLREGETPFVLGVVADARRCLEHGGVEFRRGTDRVVIDWKLQALRLRAIVLNEAGGSYLMASAGSMLDDWWPLLRREGGDPRRPLLSAATTRSAQTFTGGGRSAKVSIAGSAEGIDITSAVIGLERESSISDFTLAYSYEYSLAVVKAALLVLTEYRTLVDPVPDVNVDMAGTQVPLVSLLDVAAETADAIAWIHAGADSDR